MNALPRSLACALVASAACGGLVGAAFIGASAALPRPALVAAVLTHRDIPARLPMPAGATLAQAAD